MFANVRGFAVFASDQVSNARRVSDVSCNVWTCTVCVDPWSNQKVQGAVHGKPSTSRSRPVGDVLKMYRHWATTVALYDPGECTFENERNAFGFPSFQTTNTRRVSGW